MFGLPLLNTPICIYDNMSEEDFLQPAHLLANLLQRQANWSRLVTVGTACTKCLFEACRVQRKAIRKEGGKDGACNAENRYSAAASSN